jgi:lambda family phage tail tape measure protein
MPVDKRESRLELTAIDKASAVIRQVQGSVENLRSSVDTIKNALAAVGVTVGAGAMLKLYADTLKANSGFADLKLQTGSSVENLSRISEIARIGSQDFGGFTEQLGRMVKGLKSGNDEGQLASAAMKFLGVQVKDANGTFRDTGDIVFDVAKALQRYTDDGNDMALVQDALGKGAQKYLPLLKDMAEASGEHAKLTGEQARQAKELESNINRLKGGFEDARRELVINLTPAVLEFTEQLLAAKAATGGLGSGLFTTLITDTDSVRDHLRGLRADLAIIEEAEQKQAQSGGGVLRGLMSDWFGGSMERGAQQIRNQIGFLEELQRRRDAAAAKAGARDSSSPFFEFPQPSGYQSPDLHKNDTESKLYTRSLQQLEEELGKLNDLGKAEIVINRVSTGSWKDLTLEHKAALIALGGEYDDRKLQLEQQKQFVEAWTNEARVLDASRSVHKAQLESYRAEREELEFQATLLGKTPRQLELANAERKIELDMRSRLATLPRDDDGEILPGAANAMTTIIAQADQQKKVVRGLIEDRQVAERDWLVGAKSAFAEYSDSAGNAAKNAHDFFTHTFQSMEDALVSFVRTGKLDFRSFADSVLNDIIRIQIRQALSPLATYANTAISSAGAGIASAFGFAEGGVMTSAGPLPLHRYAGGGIADSPQLAMYGEGAQPEAIVPLPDGRSIPVQMSGRGGHTFNNYIDARGADSAAINRLAAQLRALHASVEFRAVDAVKRAWASRGYATP